MAELLGISDDSAYTLIKRENIKTFLVDGWNRIDKRTFLKWYKSQRKYRTAEDRQKDAPLEEKAITMPEMARMLGVTREEVYKILNKAANEDVFQIIIMGGKKRITKESFDAWYLAQSEYLLKDQSPIVSPENKPLTEAVAERRYDPEKKTFSAKEAAALIGVPIREIYRLIENETLSCFYVGKQVRIPANALSWWLNPQNDIQEGENEYGVNCKEK